MARAVAAVGQLSGGNVEATLDVHVYGHLGTFGLSDAIGVEMAGCRDHDLLAVTAAGRERADLTGAVVRARHVGMPGVCVLATFAESDVATDGPAIGVCVHAACAVRALDTD